MQCVDFPKIRVKCKCNFSKWSKSVKVDQKITLFLKLKFVKFGSKMHQIPEFYKLLIDHSKNYRQKASNPPVKTKKGYF